MNTQTTTNNQRPQFEFRDAERTPKLRRHVRRCEHRNERRNAARELQRFTMEDAYAEDAA